MRYGEPTVSWPTDPAKLYIYCMFHEFFWGPYDNIEEVRAAMKRMTTRFEFWDYDPSAIVRGDATPELLRRIEKLTYVSRHTGENI